MEIISKYTRKQAIKDKLQFLLLESLTQQLYKYPVYITSGVNDLINQAVENKKWGNDREGVLWDILWMGKQPKMVTQSKGLFQVIITGVGRKRLHTLVSKCGPIDIDNGAPALTIMLKEEDQSQL